MNILGIETSCDETAAAVVTDGRRVRSNVVASQIALHQTHGGVVPELAARQHVVAIVPVVQAAMREADLDRDGIDAVAVTEGPGLAGALLVGVNVAKALAYAWGKPLLPVNHLEAHIYAGWLDPPGAGPESPPEFPIVCLLVSGGHTELILMTAHGQYQQLGRTLDDAAGEAFDKGARLLGLGYPGGPAIAAAARTGVAERFALPRSWLGAGYDFSFSGLKTALLRLTEPYRRAEVPPTTASAVHIPFPEHRPPTFAADMPVPDLAAAFQDAIVDVLAVKAARAARDFQAKTVLLVGGVAANLVLRQRLRNEVERLGGDGPIAVRTPVPAFCTDNAAMVAGAAFVARRGDGTGWGLDVHPRLPLATSDVDSLTADDVPWSSLTRS